MGTRPSMGETHDVPPNCWDQLSCCCCHSSHVLFLTQLPPTGRCFRVCELLYWYHIQQIPSTKLLLQHMEPWHQLNELVVRPAIIWWHAMHFLRSSWAILTEIALIKPMQTLSRVRLLFVEEASNWRQESYSKGSFRQLYLRRVIKILAVVSEFFSFPSPKDKKRYHTAVWQGQRVDVQV